MIVCKLIVSVQPTTGIRVVLFNISPYAKEDG